MTSSALESSHLRVSPCLYQERVCNGLCLLGFQFPPQTESKHFQRYFMKNYIAQKVEDAGSLKLQRNIREYCQMHDVLEISVGMKGLKEILIDREILI